MAHVLDGYPQYPIPSLEACIDLNLRLARLTNPAVRCVGASVNTATLSAEQRTRELGGVSERLGVPCVDPIAAGVGPLVDHLTATHVQRG